jgi:D-beta-D-heptose 7-phosphate kinase/D-beta-D-heptose 1-phosphate adenosyltransferase
MDLLNKFSEARILVIGDLMLDRYWWGTVERISPEAPVPVVQISNTSISLGGAANVAANIVGLGSEVALVGATGQDSEAADLRQLLNSTGISTEFILPLDDRPTSLKTRIVAHSQQVVRADHESNSPIGFDVEEEALKAINAMISSIDLIVLSDYAKGFLTTRLATEVIRLASTVNKYVLVDPKGKDYAKYSGAAVLTPNFRELSEISHANLDSCEDLEKAARKLINELSVDNIIVTQGEHGMTLFPNDSPSFHVDSKGRHVYDVTGAGDTVIATLAVALSSDMPLDIAVSLANTAAGIVVEEVGTTVITTEKLLSEVGDLTGSNPKTVRSQV